MNRACEFSPCRKWRYTLWRSWGDDLFRNRTNDGYAMFIGLNPSTADELQDDPTIRRCIDFAKRWGYLELCMTNIFAWRDTDPEGMRIQLDPIGPENDRHLVECADGADIIIAAWGKHGAHRHRADAVMKTIKNLHCLKINSDGSPQHPLYIAATTKPIPYEIQNR